MRPAAFLSIPPPILIPRQRFSPSFSKAMIKELVTYAVGGLKPNEIDFEEILSERPSHFKRVVITSKAKPRESMVPESASATPLPITTIAAPTVNSILKSMAKDILASTSQLSKQLEKSVTKKKTTLVLAWDSCEGATQSLDVDLKWALWLNT
ncbi:hypothetical protein LIER_43064 [Lithospermum erythrorhizon]|uniref:Uncharacterized protein n=1 Tax=Lithospermum erythrorhizon TaxID=34254 RepID=A0AAV3PFW2_LITER